ncbi:zinc finger protein 235-like [Perca fluviatilis]|uniref:zinc finger protein 235-like n=1 Tax=Perca fluviatilis TaxID=8168 RepID=UPI001966CA96|nr:zinc finger protein 235-like [Perca fluviatilis]
MSKVHILRALVKQRLTAAAEEIFGLFERTIAEYEEERCRSKEENERQRELLDADVQQLSVREEEVPPEQREWSPSLDQQHPEPPHIKEEQEELWISQEREQLQGLEEADITKFPFTPVPVKSEDDEEKPQPSQLHQRQDCGGPEPAKNSDPDIDLHINIEDQTGDSSEPETDDSNEWKETREARPGLNSLEKKAVPACDSRCSKPACQKPFSCSECGKRFGCKSHLKGHMMIHTGERPFSCSVCGKRFGRKTHLKGHMMIHTGQKPFSCSVCNKSFARNNTLRLHMRTHTGERPFSCSVCDQRFTWLLQLRNHQRVCCQSSQLHQRQTEQMETEADGEDCGGPEPARKSDPDRHPEPETGDSSEPETDRQ